MIDFQKLDIAAREKYDAFLMHNGERGCEYSFVNLYLWGRQRAAFVDGFLTLFSQFQRKSVYPFPIGQGDLKKVLDAIIHDARKRGLVCRFTSLTAADCATLEELYPGKFFFHPDRDACDYIYDINNLADLPGRKYQRKRNHVNRFRAAHPNCRAVLIDAALLPAVQEMVDKWFQDRMAPDAQDEYHTELVALRRAFDNWEALGLEGMALVEDGRVLAMTIGSMLGEKTFDVHFEKALDEVDGAYAAINQSFASYIRENYPTVKYLNREDDLGIEGLRKAKLSYYPDHLVVKFWADLWEDGDED